MTDPPPWFPLELLAVGRSGRGATAPGTYLRWLVKPYLGIPGVAPLRESRRDGFRMFFAARHDAPPPLEPIDLGPTLRDDQLDAIVDVADQPGWKAFMPRAGRPVKLEVRLGGHFGNDVVYLRLDYRVHTQQELHLHYVVHDAAAGTDVEHAVPLHYENLSTALSRRERERGEPDPFEDLSYAIHVDELHESITGMWLVSNQPIVFRGVYIARAANRSFYRWSPPGGDSVWTEIGSHMQLLRTFDDQLIRPGRPDRLVEAMAEFYERYYSVAPHSADRHRWIHFSHPHITTLSLAEPLARHYDAEQYDQLLQGYEPRAHAPSMAHLPSQHATALASADPAIAYVLGLFRVLSVEPGEFGACVFKIQGTWGEGRRVAAYRDFDPNVGLSPPRMRPVTATPASSDRVVRDEATSRTHTHISVADVAWSEPTAEHSSSSIRFGPVAYLLVCRDSVRRGHRCRSAFFVPQEDDVGSAGELHFTDWYDEYAGTDIPKVLDGDYGYAVSAFDLFGQLSDFESDDVTVSPVRLEPGEIQKPQVRLSRAPDPAQPTDQSKKTALDIPLEVEPQGSGYRLRAFNRDHVKVDYSFFWPLDARYLWDRNRKTGSPSVDHFELWHLPGTPRQAGVSLRVVDNGADGVVCELDDVASGRTRNRALFALLDRLGAVDATGDLRAGPAEQALVGGSLALELNWKIVSATIDATQQLITLGMVPAADAAHKRLAAERGWLDGITLRTEGPHHGELYWNPDAKYASQPLGWQRLGNPTLEVRPSPPIAHSGQLVAAAHMPVGDVGLPPDLSTTVGLTAVALSPPTLPPVAAPAVPNHFIVRLPAQAAAAKHDRLMIVPVDATSALEPGEYPAPPLPNEAGIDHPEDVTTLFSEDRLVAFTVTRMGDDPQYPNTAVYRGDPVSFTSTVAGSAGEYLVYPDPAHLAWQIVTPTIVHDLEVPLAALFEGRTFGSDAYTSSTLTVAARAVTSALDPEVTNSLQQPQAALKLGFALYQAPPKVVVPGKPQPSFGLDAGAPDFEGISLIRLETIYSGYGLDAKLSNSYNYTLFRLPAERIVGGDVQIVYAQNVAAGGMYQRNLQQVSGALATIHATDPLGTKTLQEAFDDRGQRMQQTPLPKKAFLRSAVPLAGNASTVFFYALKPSDPASGKEADAFVALSPPVYVEDPSSLHRPEIVRSDFRMSQRPVAGTTITSFDFEFGVRRRLNDFPRYGYAAPTDLTSSRLGADFAQLIAGYTVYVATVNLARKEEVERLVSPNNSDFAAITGPKERIGDGNASIDLGALAIMIDPGRLSYSSSPSALEIVTIIGSVDFAPGIDPSKIPSRVFTCLRAESYLGQRSPLDLSPMALRGA